MAAIGIILRRLEAWEATDALAAVHPGQVQADLLEMPSRLLLHPLGLEDLPCRYSRSAWAIGEGTEASGETGHSRQAQEDGSDSGDVNQRRAGSGRTKRVVHLRG